jgi:hypothetical protein
LREVFAVSTGRGLVVGGAGLEASVQVYNIAGITELANRDLAAAP